MILDFEGGVRSREKKRDASTLTCSSQSGLRFDERGSILEEERNGNNQVLVLYTQKPHEQRTKTYRTPKPKEGS